MTLSPIWKNDVNTTTSMLQQVKLLSSAHEVAIQMTESGGMWIRFYYYTKDDDMICISTIASPADATELKDPGAMMVRIAQGAWREYLAKTSKKEVVDED